MSIGPNQRRFAGADKSGPDGLTSAELDLSMNILVGATSADWGRGIDAWFARRMRHDRPRVWERCVSFWHHSSETEQAELGVKLGWVEPGKLKSYFPAELIREFEEVEQAARRLFGIATEERMRLR